MTSESLLSFGFPINSPKTNLVLHVRTPVVYMASDTSFQLRNYDKLAIGSYLRLHSVFMTEFNVQSRYAARNTHSGVNMCWLATTVQQFL